MKKMLDHYTLINMVFGQHMAGNISIELAEQLKRVINEHKKLTQGFNSEIKETIQSDTGRGIIINRTIHLNVDGAVEYKTLTDEIIKELAKKGEGQSI